MFQGIAVNPSRDPTRLSSKHSGQKGIAMEGAQWLHIIRCRYASNSVITKERYATHASGAFDQMLSCRQCRMVTHLSKRCNYILLEEVEEGLREGNWALQQGAPALMRPPSNIEWWSCNTKIGHFLDIYQILLEKMVSRFRITAPSRISSVYTFCTICMLSTAFSCHKCLLLRGA